MADKSLIGDWARSVTEKLADYERMVNGIAVGGEFNKFRPSCATHVTAAEEVDVEDALIAAIDGETDEEDEERQYRSSNSIKVAGETGRVRRTRHKVRGDIVRISTFSSPEAEKYRGVAGMKFYRDNTPRPGGKKRRNRNRGRRANQR